MIRNKIFVWFFASIIGLGCFSGVYGQQTNTLYFLDMLPQSNQLNPANLPSCRTHVGLPGVSSIMVNAPNNGASLYDVMYHDGDSLIPFWTSKGDTAQFVNAFGDYNYFGMEANVDLLSFGFYSGDMYYGFSIRERADGRFFYPDDLARLPFGTEPGSILDFDNFGFNLSWFREYAFTMGKNFGGDWTFGARGKLLFGKANFNTQNNKLQIRTDITEWYPQSDVLYRMSAPILEPTYEDGEMDGIKMKDENSFDPMDLVFYSKNIGLAFDLGAKYEPTDELSLSASVVDLGFIRWRSDAYSYTQEGSFYFRGLEWPIDSLEGAGESYLDSASMTTGEGPYTTMLSGKVYFGGRYNVTDNFYLGLLSRTLIQNNHIHENVMFSTNVNLSNILTTSLSYSAMHRSYNNIGFGLGVRAAFFNFYLMSDNALSAVLWPQYTKSLNLRVGLNLLFGCRPQIDMPSIY